MGDLAGLVFDQFGAFLTEFGPILAIPIGVSVFALMLGALISAIRKQ